jgi:Fic family protein
MGAESVTAWTPIEPLSTAEREIDASEVKALAEVWHDARATLQEENARALTDFNERLRRAWSIETGILENLYMLDRGTTQTLVDRGFHQELVNRADTNIEPADLVAILRDHLAASEMVQGLIEESGPLTPHFIRQLHALITRNQTTVEAVDSLGRVVAAEPLRGQWKQLPNWRELDDGSRRAYCPPFEVEYQIQDLLQYLEWQLSEDIDISVVAAWLHHRFTLIHPFQDGNGRIARALVNYLFVSRRLFPVVVQRDQKGTYIDALRAADDGDLQPLVQIFAAKQIEAIKQALSLTGVQPESRRTPLVRELAQGVIARVRHRQEQEQQQFRRVDGVMKELWTSAQECIASQLETFAAELRSADLPINTDVDAGGPEDERAQYYRWQVVESAKQAEQWANFNEESRWVRGLVSNRQTQMRFILSFHHVGRVLTGIGEVTSIADLEIRHDNAAEPELNRTPVACMIMPFTLTWRDEPAAIGARFETWVGECLVVALRNWAETI